MAGSGARVACVYGVPALECVECSSVKMTIQMPATKRAPKSNNNSTDTYRYPATDILS